MVGNKFTVIVVYITLLITFLGLISMIFNLHRFAFYGEFLILLALFLAAIASALGINNDSRWAWILLALLFAFVFLNMLFIRAITTEKIGFFLHLIIVAIAGFFISLFSIEKEKVEAEVKKEFKPGKYIASKTGAKFHAPKCDWAKKIKKENAVWFNNKEDALKAGYKKDDCVK